MELNLIYAGTKCVFDINSNIVLSYIKELCTKIFPLKPKTFELFYNQENLKSYDDNTQLKEIIDNNENEENLFNIKKTNTTLIKNTKEIKKNNNNKIEKEKEKENEKYDIIQERIKIDIIQNLPITFRTGDDKHRLIKQFRNFGDITRVKFQKKK